jgi:hypothetical protein
MPPNSKNTFRFCLHETINRQTGCCEKCKQFVGFPFAIDEIELVKMVRTIKEANAKMEAKSVAKQEPEKPKTEWRLAPGFHWDEYGNCVKE